MHPLHDVFTRLSDEFSSLFLDDDFDVSEDFSGGGVFGGVAEVSVVPCPCLILGLARLDQCGFSSV